MRETDRPERSLTEEEIRTMSDGELISAIKERDSVLIERGRRGLTGGRIFAEAQALQRELDSRPV